MDYESSSDRDTPKDMLETSSRPDTPGAFPEHLYSKDELLKLQEVPASRKRPACLAEEFCLSDGVWDPEKWFRSFDNSRNNSPLTIDREKKRFDLDYFNKRRPSDPKERLKEEKDGIVLSPQRRSFGTGCHVVPSVTRQTSCPSDFKEGPERDPRGNRRIGSGRIQLDRDRDRDGPPARTAESGRDIRAIKDRFEREDRERERRFDRDNRGFRREFDDRERRDFRRFGRDSRDDRQRKDSYNRREEEEPEWFVSGPASQSETIELGGFEKIGDKRKKKLEAKLKEEKEEEETESIKNKEKEEATPIIEPADETPEDERHQVSSVANVTDRNGSLETNESSSPEDVNRSGGEGSVANVFDFNEFFKKTSNIPGLSDGEADSVSGGQDMAGQSRFSHWFVNKPKESSNANSREQSRRSSLNEEFSNFLPNDLLNGTRSPVIPSPPPYNSLFDQSVFSMSANSTFADKPQHHSVDFSGPVKIPNASLIGAIFNQPEKPASVSSNYSTQDAESQLKAILFGRKDSVNNSGTSSPSINSPLGIQGKVKTLAELEADLNRRSHSPQAQMSQYQQNLERLALAKQHLQTQMSHSASASPAIPQQHPQQQHHHQQHPHQQHPHHLQQIQQQQQQQHIHTQQHPQQERRHSQEEDLTAFNKLLSLMTAAANENSPKIVRGRQETRPISPNFAQNYVTSGVAGQNLSNPMSSNIAQNEFLQALQKNKEQQQRMQSLHQLKRTNPGKVMTAQQMQQGGGAGGHHQQQHHQPPSASHGLGPGHGDPIMNFLKQNPTIITKSASPTPPPTLAPPPSLPQQGTPVLNSVVQQQAIMSVMQATSTPRAPSPATLLQQTLLSQQSSSPRVPSPIMFGQQPPLHLSAPSPIHPSNAGQASPINVPGASTMTSTATIRPPVVPRVPSPQELIAHTQAIMQNALLKKQLEDQKERFIKKQQERGKSPNPLMENGKGPQTSTPVSAPSGQTSKASVMAAFTPTSVIRKMHSDKANEKEKQKQENEGEDIRKAQGKPPILSSKEEADKLENDPLLHQSFNTQSDQPAYKMSTVNMQPMPESYGTHKNMSVSIAEQLSQMQLSQAVAAAAAKSRPLIGQGSMNTSLGAVPTSNMLMTPGRPIVKGPGGQQMMPNAHGAPVSSTPIRSLTGPSSMAMTPSLAKSSDPSIMSQTPSSLAASRAITGTLAAASVGVTPVVSQRQISPNPLTRPLTGTPVAGPYGIPMGRLPLQPGLPHGPIYVQHVLQGGISPAAAATASPVNISQLNQINHLNQLNHLAMQQPRLMDPRQTGVRLVNMPYHLPGGMRAGMVNGNNNKQSDPNLSKWFGNDVLKTQMPTMPPLPNQGQQAMTVDELERCQAVSN